MNHPLLVFSMSFILGWFGVSWKAIDDKIANSYPAVAHIESSELLSLYNSGRMPAIIDVRTAEEFAVSHLAGARNLETAEAIAAAIPDTNTAIIVYCSVGYRSAGVAENLARLGYGEVRNLRHSIFSWAESGYPMRNGAGDTDRVHPYNRIWGSLVSRNLHAWEPASDE